MAYLQTYPVQEITVNFSMMTMNMNGESGKGATDYRRESISQAITTKKPDIIFAQEISAPGSSNWLLDIEGYSFCGITTEAGISVRKATFSINKIIGSDDKIRVADHVASLGTPNTDEFSSRSCIVVLRHDLTGVNLLCASWHGPHKQKNKDMILQAFLICVDTLGKSIGVQDVIVIGGDFNFRSSQAEKYMMYGFDVLTDNPNAIDYFVHRGLTFLNVERCEYEKNKGKLDHDYVTASVASFSVRKPLVPPSQPQPGPTQSQTRHGSAQFQTQPGPHQYQ